jgi:Uma2 family endonuclease
MSAMPLEQEIEYPTSDGQPMAETALHREIMADTIAALERRYAAAPDVWVGGNLFLCYEKGNPSAALAPDVLLAQGVSKWMRPNYLLWQETPPRLIVEITSRSTRREDLGEKKRIYESLGVEEYILFDPYGEYLDPPLQGYRLADGPYQPIRSARDGSLVSLTTGLRLRTEGNRLRLVDAATGEPLPWIDELGERLDQSERARLEAERARAEAEARAAALEERLRALEGKGSR